VKNSRPRKQATPTTTHVTLRTVTGLRFSARLIERVFSPEFPFWPSGRQECTPVCFQSSGFERSFFPGSSHRLSTALLSALGRLRFGLRLLNSWRPLPWSVADTKPTGTRRGLIPSRFQHQTSQCKLPEARTPLSAVPMTALNLKHQGIHAVFRVA